jgi:hypothetical protein
MIRDFLDHLLWEVRTFHLEAMQRVENPLRKDHPVNQELADQLSKYYAKYGRWLLPATAIRIDRVTEEEAADVIRGIYGAKAQVYEEWIQHLEELQGLFCGALKCATLPCRTYEQPMEILRAQDFLERPRDAGDDEPVESGEYRPEEFMPDQDESPDDSEGE